MKIGVFDSGLGGLIVLHSLVQKLPSYDFMYLGDTARVPYGNRSQTTIYEFTQQAVDYLFNQDCDLIIVACNTASAEALRKIQQDYLPQGCYPDRRVLGVLIPTAEAAVAATQNHKIGVLATTATVNSNAFVRELQKIDPHVEVIQDAAPLLVPMLENDGKAWIGPVLESYLEPLLNAHVDTLILGSTHYQLLKEEIRARIGSNIKVISQDEVVPQKLEDYLERHPEIDSKLDKSGQCQFLVTDKTSAIENLATQLFGDSILLEQVSLITR